MTTNKCQNCRHKIHKTEYGEWHHEARHHTYCKCLKAEPEVEK